jgi:hypothetical protein
LVLLAAMLREGGVRCLVFLCGELVWLWLCHAVVQGFAVGYPSCPIWPVASF